MNFNERARLRFEGSMKNADSAEQAFRRHAWDAFERLGLPGKTAESWKYSAVSELTETPWTEAPAVTEESQAIRNLRGLFAADFEIVVLMNGKTRGNPSGEFQLKPRTLDVTGTPLNFDDGFLSASAAVNQGGFELSVADGVRVVRPLLLVHVCTGAGAWNSTLNRIALGRASELQLAELFVSESGAGLRTDITRAEIGDGAHLTWVRTQQENPSATYFGEVQAHVRKLGRLALTQLNCGAAWSRGSLKADLHGEGAEVSINGLTFGRDEQHLDQRVQVSHHASNTSSAQLFKGIFDGKSRGVLNGKIYIAHGAQKVASSQLNHNLLLSPFAEANTKPELEVYADDVKANHGASIGRLDEGKLFYLMSRGIKRSDAEKILAQAFSADVLMKIPSLVLRKFASARVADYITGGTA